MLIIAAVMVTLIVVQSISLDRIATFIVGLLVFVAGLLAWRLQLLDKRRFEVAEQVVTVHAKVADGIRALRQRHGMVGLDETKFPGARALFRAKRRWYFGMRDDKLKAFEEVYKELAPTRVLARLYLTEDIAKRLDVLDYAFESVKYAAFKLGEIDPEFGGDLLFLPGDRPPLDQPEDPDESPSEEEMLKTQEEELPVRFVPFLSLTDEEDELSERIKSRGVEIEALCRPYKNINPWHFLGRFALMFIATRDESP